MSDVAHAHTLAIEYLLKNPELQYEVFNLGTGKGITVLEALNAFEKANKLKLNYKLGPRREGDVVAVYSDNKKAEDKLRWKPGFSFEDMMRTAWEWEKAVSK